MSYPHFDVDITAAGRASKVLLDGVDIANKIRSIKINASVDAITTVEVEFVATVSGTVDGELADITALDATWREYAPNRT